MRLKVTFLLTSILFLTIFVNSAFEQSVNPKLNKNEKEIMQLVYISMLLKDIDNSNVIVFDKYKFSKRNKFRKLFYRDLNNNVSDYIEFRKKNRKVVRVISNGTKENFKIKYGKNSNGEKIITLKGKLGVELTSKQGTNYPVRLYVSRTKVVSSFGSNVYAYKFIDIHYDSKMRISTLNTSYDVAIESARDQPELSYELLFSYFLKVKHFEYNTKGNLILVLSEVFKKKMNKNSLEIKLSSTEVHLSYGYRNITTITSEGSIEDRKIKYSFDKKKRIKKKTNFYPDSDDKKSKVLFKFNKEGQIYKIVRYKYKEGKRKYIDKYVEKYVFKSCAKNASAIVTTGKFYNAKKEVYREEKSDKHFRLKNKNGKWSKWKKK